MVINLNKGAGFDRVLFPDNQPHVRLHDLNRGESAFVVASLLDSKCVLELLMIANAIENHFIRPRTLVIPYLMAGRFDRVMQPGDSFDLQVIAKLINMCNFEEVIILDPHSYVAPALINRCSVVTNQLLVEKYDEKDAVLIIPDNGASKKADKYMEWNKNLTHVVSCDKKRDLGTGAITLKVLQPDECMNRHCVIIDDLCDGGGTFLQIAQQIPKCESLTLIVTHGIFSKGFGELEKYFNHIITSNSYRYGTESNIVTIVKIF